MNFHIATSSLVQHSSHICDNCLLRLTHIYSATRTKSCRLSIVELCLISDPLVLLADDRPLCSTALSLSTAVARSAAGAAAREAPVVHEPHVRCYKINYSF